MIYSYPMPFECHSELAEYTEQYMKKYNSHWFYQVNVPIAGSLRYKLDKELANYGLSHAKLWLAFKRRGYFGEQHILNSSSSLHVDYSQRTKEMTYSSIVFPVSGCKDTYQYWVEGNYTLVDADEIDPNGKRTTRQICNWHEPGIVVKEKAYIVDTPTVVRTSIPHSVVSRDDGSYRTILSVRLKNNETFEEIVEKIKTKKITNGI